MTEVVKDCGESAYVAVMRKGTVVPLAMVESDQPVRIVSQIGENLPLHCTAVGKVHLAFEPAEEVQRILSDELTLHTQRTITDRPVLIEQLGAIASKGYAVDNGEYVSDVHTVAVPSKTIRARLSAAWRSAVRPIGSRRSGQNVKSSRWPSRPATSYQTVWAIKRRR